LAAGERWRRVPQQRARAAAQARGVGRGGAAAAAAAEAAFELHPRAETRKRQHRLLHHGGFLVCALVAEVFRDPLLAVEPLPELGVRFHLSY